MVKFIIALAINIGILYFYSFYIGLIGFVLTLVAQYFGLFNEIKFYKGKFPKSEIFYYRYTGDYTKVGGEFFKINNIMSKFKLNEKNTFSSFGIYYDDPKTTAAKDCRTIIGIKREILDEIKLTENREDTDLREYLLKEGFKTEILPDIICLRSSFPYNNWITMIIGIKKFYTALNSNLKSEEFRKVFGISDPKLPFVVESYSSSEISWFVPLKINDKFMKHIQE